MMIPAANCARDAAIATAADCVCMNYPDLLSFIRSNGAPLTCGPEPVDCPKPAPRSHCQDPLGLVEAVDGAELDLCRSSDTVSPMAIFEAYYYRKHCPQKCGVDIETCVCQVYSRFNVMNSYHICQPIRRQIPVVNCCQFSVDYPHNDAYRNDGQRRLHS
jgi:hypothetical protein